MCVCVYCFRLVLKFCSVSALEDGVSARLEKEYITVSIVTCSIVAKGVLNKYTNLNELRDALRQEAAGMTVMACIHKILSNL